MKVADVMSRPHVIGEFETVYRAARSMRDNAVGALAIVGREHLVGVLTDRDLAVRAVARGEPPWELHVRDVMTRDPATCGPEDSLATAVESMTARGVRRLLVIDGARRLVGMLSLEDLARNPETLPLALRVLAQGPKLRSELDGMYPDTNS